MIKEKYEIESGELKTIIEAISPEKALVVAIRQQKFPNLSLLTRFRNANKPKGSKRDKKWLWKYKSTKVMLEGFDLIY